MEPKVYSGSELRIFLEDKKVFHATSCGISISRGTKERATKDTDGIEVSLDKLTWSATGDGLMVESLGDSVTDAHDFEALFDKMVSGDQLEVKFSLGPLGQAGDTLYSGVGFLTALDATAGVDEDATASFTITGSGTITKAVISA